MRNALAIIVLTASVFAFMPVLAQETIPGPIPDPFAEEIQKDPGDLDKMELLGLPVWSSDGQELGVVTQVQTDQNGKVEAVHADVGRFMGLGDRKVRVDASLIAVSEGRIILSISAEETLMLPDVDEHA